MRRPSRVLSGALAAFMTSFWTILPVASHAQAGQAEIAREFERSLLAIEDGVRDMERDTFDPQYVVDQVGVEPEALFTWMKERVAWIPYQGSLRGVHGTLMDRMGNSLDRSLLLAELLRLAGHESRLAHAKLSGDQVDKLWGDLTGLQQAWKVGIEEWVPPAAQASPAPQDAVASPEDLAAAEQAASDAQTPEDMLAAAESIDPIAIINGYGLDVEGVTNILDEANTSSAKLAEDIQSRTLVHWARLMDMGVVPQTSDVEERTATAKAAMAEHYWVEVNKGGNWVALDTLVPSLNYGQALTAATKALSPEQLPVESTHTVTIKLVSEQWKDGQLTQNLLLKHDMVASQMIGERISIKQLPTHWPEDWPTTTPEIFQRQLKAAAVTQTEWVPLITIGDKQFIESSVRDNGTLNPNPDVNTAFGALGVPTGGGVARVGDLFDTPVPEGEEPVAEVGDPAREEGELTAIWIDYEIRVPGKEARVVRRELFDLIGAASRALGVPTSLALTTADKTKRSVSMLSETEVLIQPCEFSPEFLLNLSSQSALANRPFLEAIGKSRDPFGQAPADLTETMLKMVPGPGTLHQLAAARFASSPVSNRVFIAEPNVLSNHIELVPSANGDFFGRTAIDIVNNTVEVSMLADNGGSMRLVQGVVDSNAEILVLGDQPHLYGAAELFEHTGLDTGGWTSLKKGEEARLFELALPPEVIARIIEDLNAGYTVVAPSAKGLSKISAGWWRIDPKTGTTLGMGANGWGTSLVEYAFVLVIKTMLAQMVCMAQAGVQEAYKQAQQRGQSSGKGLFNKAKQVGKDIKNSRDSFNKGSQAAFKFCMVTALFGGFMAMMTTPIVGQSMVPDGPRGMHPSEGFYPPPGSRIGNGPPKGLPPMFPRPRLDPPNRNNRGMDPKPNGPLPPPNAPGRRNDPKLDPKVDPKVDPKPKLNPPTPPEPARRNPNKDLPPPAPKTPRPQPTIDEVKDALKTSRDAWDRYTDAMRNNRPGNELNRLYEEGVRSEKAANQLGFKDYVGDKFDRGMHSRMREWTDAQADAYKGMNPPPNYKITPPGQTGSVDPTSPTHFDKGVDNGPITLPQPGTGGATTGTTTGVPSGPQSGSTPSTASTVVKSLAGPNSTGGPQSGSTPSTASTVVKSLAGPNSTGGPPSSSGNGPPTLDAQGYPGYPFAGPGAHSQPLPSYEPGYVRPPPPPSTPNPTLPSRGPGDINGPQPVIDGGHYTGYPFQSPPSAPAEVGLGSLANGMSKLAL